MQGTINMGKLVEAHNAIRDARTAKRHAWEAEDAALEESQNKLRAFMLSVLNQTGSRSINTDHGTVYRREVVKPSTQDWTSVYAWIAADPERFGLLEKRLTATFVKNFMDENDGALPPGVNVHREFEISVRRANNQE